MYASAEKAVDEGDENDVIPSPEVLADLTIEADLKRLRHRIGRLDRTISRHAFENALQALSALDFEVDVDAQVLAFLVSALDVDDRYSAQLTDLGLDTLRRGDLVLARLVGVDAAYVQSLQDAGYNPTLNELVQMKLAGVDGLFIEDLASEGYEALSVQALVDLRKSGVDKAVIHEMEGRGLYAPSVEEMVRYRSARGPSSD
jgi:hypothetical protein